MSYRLWLKLAALLTAVALLVAIVEAWRADRRDRAQLQSELAATKQLLATADARQHERDTQLAQTLAALAAEKRAVTTPAQIIKALPNTLSLPAPIVLQTDSTSSLGAPPGSPTANANPAATNPAEKPFVGAKLVYPEPRRASPAGPSQPTPLAGDAIIPAADLKPLYDFAIDCKTCQARLTTVQNDLLDEQKKTAALTKERDDALRIAKGGSPWRRVARAAKWFLIGAAAGAIAAKTAH